MLSSFLPATFDPQKPVALIAGQGLYPVLVAEAIRRAGVPVRLIAFDEETRPELVDGFPEADRRTLLVGQLGKMLRALEHFGAGYAYMAGQITPRRLFKGLHPDLKATRILLSLKRRNAETIFGAIAAEIEQLGVTLLDARSFLDDQLATPGVMTGGRFPDRTRIPRPRRPPRPRGRAARHRPGRRRAQGHRAGGRGLRGHRRDAPPRRLLQDHATPCS